MDGARPTGVIVTYQSEHIPFMWGSVEPLIERALKRGSIYTKEDVYNKLRASEFQLWTWQTPDIEAVMTTGIIEDECYLITMAGKNMKDWVNTLPLVETWAASEGCRSMVIQGRKGWSKVLGYDITGRDDLGLYIMRKKLWQTQDQPKTQTTKPASHP